jgi:DNA-directed RNA polymerase beta' subunit
MEMNLHMPQDPESEAELKNLAAVPYQIISPANNSSIIGIYQDSMLGSYQFTREGISFSPREAMNLLMMFNAVNENELIKNVESERGITNFDILSQIMPPLSMKYKTKAFKEDKDDPKLSNAVLEIKNGQYIRGQMDKGVLGAGTKGLLQRICNDFGNMASAKFIDDLQNVVTEYMKSTAFSVGISDLISDQKTNEEIIKIITQKKTEVKNLIDQTQIGIFENNTGKTNVEEFETQVNNILNQATSESGKVGLKSLAKDNRFVTMVLAGSKGSDLNISFMISCLGQQNVDGKRIPYGFEHRTLPHYTKYDDSPGARGFVENSYINGLSPQELFFHAMGGRVGLIDTAVKTSSTGYIQRRLIKGLEDLMVGYDMTVRTNKNKIVQFAFGDDNIDTVKVENQSIPLVSMSMQDIYSHYLLPEENNRIKTLNNIFLKNTMTRYKKQNDEMMKQTKKYIDMMIKMRDEIIKHVFKNKGDSVVNLPVAFSYIINNVQGQTNLTSSSLVDITPLEALQMIEQCYANLEKNYYAPPTQLFKTLFFFYLCPKDLLIVKRFNKSALTLLLDKITIDYKRAIVTPGEMVGMIAGQSIGEVSTQMSLVSSQKIKLIQKNKITSNISCLSIEIGEFCDNLIKQLPDVTFNTGHENSVETLLDKLEDEYYIIGVSKDEKTHWNKISHVSRHPVNGQVMKVTTRSGRIVETTTSHSHLIRDETTQSVIPIVGADMKIGMRIPVAKHIDNLFVKDTISIDSKEYKLDYLFGWFIGAYLAEGNINYNEISITNISQHYIENTQKIAQMFDKECRICEKQSEYGKTITTKFNSPHLAKLLINSCGNGSYVKRVPDFAFTGPMEFKAGLFQGYFDGNENFQCDAIHHQMRCCSRSLQLVKDLSLILNYFGIFANIKMENHNKNPLYHLNIASKYVKIYAEKIGSVLHKEKLQDIVNYLERNEVKLLTEYIDRINGIGNIIAKCGKELALLGQSRNYGYYKNKESVGRRTLEKYIGIFETHPDSYKIQNEIHTLKQAANSDVIWDEIVNIELYTPDQTNYVYDFTIPGNQTFMTDYGVIVHNTLNSVTFETEIIVRNARQEIQKVQIGEFIENKIKIAKTIEYYKDKDTTYAEVDDYYEIPSCDEDGNILWKRIEAVTRHPVINKDGTNTMLKITTSEEREVIATKAKSFLKLVNGKIIAVDGDCLKVGDYLPVSKKQIDFIEKRELELKQILPPTEYIYSSEVEKAVEVMKEHRWWSKHQGKTFTLPYNRSDSFVAKVSDKLRNGCKTKTTFSPNCVYTLQTNMNNYNIPEVIPLDYNFGYLIGAYSAEGCMTKFQISIANNDEIYFAPILELCEKWNITTKIYRHENKGKEGWTSQDLRIYNTLLCRILENLCGKLSHNKFVSDKIIFSNKECLLGFLDAYIGGDGTINKKDKSIVISSVSKELLIDVQQILNVLDIYGYIKIGSKVTKNNRGTLPENIHQIYRLFIRNKQAQMLASILNMKLEYKQENLKIILNNNYKYEIHKNATIVPNEIDGKITFEEKNDTQYLGVIFDKIKSIEEVSNTTNYAYDLTVSDTKNFNIYNGLALRDTFHFAGVASKSNVTRGVPRIEEILSLSSEPKNPSLTVHLKPEDETQKDKARSIMYMLEHTKLEEIVKSIEICFDPDDLNTLISEDKDTIEQYKAFENMVAECSETSLNNDENEKSKWIIRMIMDPEIMLEKNITMDDVNFTLNNSYENQISCIYSDYNSDKLIFRIRMNEVIKNGTSRGGKKKTKINPLDQSDQIYILKNFQDQLLQNIVLRGIKGINKVILRKIKDNLIENNGIYKKQDIWVLDTIGTNLLDVLGLDFIDSERTYSNDIVEIYNILGIEAARQSIYNELVEVIEFDGTYINYHNFSVLVDRMTFTHKMISIFRHGINNDNIGPIAKASFEETPEMFLKAARHAELDTLRGISANVMCGQEGFFGTSAFQVVLDIEEMQKLGETTNYEPLNVDNEIEKFFGNIENPNDPCGINKLTIQNNVITIKPENMGSDNNYDPGF